MTVYYEWDIEVVQDVETLDKESGEILEHMHQESYRQVLDFIHRNPPEEGTRYDVVLVRDDDEGRSWSYMGLDGKLDEFFYDAYLKKTSKVPKRFHVEVERANNKGQYHE